MSVSNEDIRRLLSEQGLLRDPAIRDDDSLFDSGALDSLRLMELVARLEAEFGIRVAPDDLAPENFETIAAIAAYAARRRAAAADAR